MSLSAVQAIIISSILLALRHKWGWLFSGDAEVVDQVAQIMPFIACVALLDGIQGVLSGNSYYSSIYCGNKRYLTNSAYPPLIMKLFYVVYTSKNLLLFT